jgi:hypothetical protein
MTKLVKYNSELVDYIDGDEVTSLYLLSDVLRLNHSDSGKLTLSQSFSCEVSDLLDKKQMHSFFPDRRVMRTTAQNYTKGITNKVRFRENLDRLRADGCVEEVAYLELHELIKDAHCPPVKLLERLIRLGHITVAKDLDFYDEDPLLEKSIDLLSQFIEALP